jgi:hypothetical protein
MTRNDFNFICSSNAVSPDIALENERVRALLKRSIHPHNSKYEVAKDVKLQLELNTIIQQEF